MDRIVIFDTTLRDGEQSPGFSMNVEEKLKMARQLERLQVDVIKSMLLKRGSRLPLKAISKR